MDFSPSNCPLSVELEYLWMAMMLGFWARSVLIIWSEVQGGEGAVRGCSSVPLWHLVRQTGAFKQLNLSDHSHQLMLVYYLSSSTAIMQSFDVHFYSHLLTLPYIPQGGRGISVT